MANSIFHSRQIGNQTWLVQGDGCNSYLVVGDNCGVVVDTGFSTENIKLYAQTLTDKPIKMAANTHGHFDHTGGNGWFPRAYMSAKALEIAKIPYPSKAGFQYPMEYLVTIVGDGDVIDLGNRELEVIEIPAHAPSSVAFLDRKEHILFTGDEVEPTAMLYWMQEEPQPTVEQHAKNMEKLLAHRAGFDFLCGGHELVMGAAALVEDFLELDRKVMAGLQGEPMVLRPGGPADFHMYQIEFKRMCTYKSVTLGYDIRYIFDRKIEPRQA